MSQRTVVQQPITGEDDSVTDSESVFEDEGVEQAKTFPCPKDCYGDMLISFLSSMSMHDIFDERPTGMIPLHAGKAALWALISVFFFVLNAVLQIGLTLGLYLTYIKPLWKPYASGLDEKMQMLQGAIKSSTPLDGTNEAYLLCKANEAMPTVYYLVLFLWLTKMVDEFWLAATEMYVFLKIPTLGQHEEGHMEDHGTRVHKFAVVEISVTGDEDKTYKITAMSPGARLFAIIFISGLRVIISVWVAYLGCAFLLMASNMSALVLKALAMQYFVSIDEMLYNGYVSMVKKGHMAKTTFTYFAPPSPEWGQWQATTGRFVLVVSFLCFVHLYIYGDLNSFRMQCAQYWNNFPTDGPQKLFIV